MFDVLTNKTKSRIEQKLDLIIDKFNLDFIEPELEDTTVDDHELDNITVGDYIRDEFKELRKIERSNQLTQFDKKRIAQARILYDLFPSLFPYGSVLLLDGSQNGSFSTTGQGELFSHTVEDGKVVVMRKFNLPAFPVKTVTDTVDYLDPVYPSVTIRVDGQDIMSGRKEDNNQDQYGIIPPDFDFMAVKPVTGGQEISVQMYEKFDGDNWSTSHNFAVSLLCHQFSSDEFSRLQEIARIF